MTHPALRRARNDDGEGENVIKHYAFRVGSWYDIANRLEATHPGPAEYIRRVLHASKERDPQAVVEIRLNEYVVDRVTTEIRPVKVNP